MSWEEKQTFPCILYFAYRNLYNKLKRIAKQTCYYKRFAQYKQDTFPKKLADFEINNRKN